MIESPDAVYLIIPLMKELHMSWSEIKDTPRFELVGLLGALGNYSTLHSFDGYTNENIGEMAKSNPGIRGDYNRYMEMKAKYERRTGKQKKVQSFSELMR